MQGTLPQSNKIVINLPRKDLQEAKGKPDPFSGYRNPLVYTDRQTQIMWLLYKNIILPGILIDAYSSRRWFFFFHLKINWMYFGDFFLKPGNMTSIDNTYSINKPWLTYFRGTIEG